MVNLPLLSMVIPPSHRDKYWDISSKSVLPSTGNLLKMT